MVLIFPGQFIWIELEHYWFLAICAHTLVSHMFVRLWARLVGLINLLEFRVLHVFFSFSWKSSYYKFLKYCDLQTCGIFFDLQNFGIFFFQVEIKRTIPKGSADSKDFKTRKIFVGGIPTTMTEGNIVPFCSILILTSSIVWQLQ